jgi:NADH-quinone oxidoreductase subunit G
MVEIELDGKKIEVLEGSMVMHAAEKAGTFIPHFCYHKKLSIAANCRMCLVDVEKAPKPMPACATPVTQGMVVRTQSDKASKAQKSVMEFLLINHPLDCPICDQGGECQLQDLAVGYGGSASRYQEEKRVVFHKDVGPLISMQEMSRCIHCTRCVRFGQEIAGVMELGMTHRGEHSEIESFLGTTVDSELSGNMIDICPVGALTSKPFRYQARTWELSRRKSISPHDATGTNLVMQVKNHQVLRVVPLENEAINECWIADRDRFSYEALNSSDRLKSPMIKQAGVWSEVDWQTALDFISHGLKDIKASHGAQSIGTLIGPSSTLEELYLAGELTRAFGSQNIDARLRAADFHHEGLVHWLGTSIASLAQMQRVLVIGSNIRKEQPLLAQRIRQACKVGAQVLSINAFEPDWAMSVQEALNVPSKEWTHALAELCVQVAQLTQASLPNELKSFVAEGQSDDVSISKIAKSLTDVQGNKCILLGNAFAHHPHSSSLLAMVNWIADHTGCTFGFLGESANTVGAQYVGARPALNSLGLNTQQMLLPGALKAAMLVNVEPQFDCANPKQAIEALNQMDLVVSLSPFKTNLEFSDVLLPIAPFSETPGTFINTEGLVQAFYAVVKPKAEARPAWKVLRVLANVLDVPGFDFETVEELRAKIQSSLPSIKSVLSNKTQAVIDLTVSDLEPCVSPSYQLDGLVRRSSSLQMTADARMGR